MISFVDLIRLAVGNLWRMKLRTTLTTAGVVIAIAAFVSMLSFGAGMQQNVTRQFNELGLFNTMQVYPQDEDDVLDSTDVAVLDNEALERLMKIPGVRMAFPLDVFTVAVTGNDTSVTSEAQALPVAAFELGLFSQLESGEFYQSDSSREVLVSESMAERLGYEEPDSAVGKFISVSTEAISLDSGFVGLITDETGEMGERLREIRFDSLQRADYRDRVLRRELREAARRFFDGLMNDREIISDSLEIVGVMTDRPHGRARMRSLIIPTVTALRLNSGLLSGDPLEMLSALRSGRLFGEQAATDVRSYPQVTLDVDPGTPPKEIIDSVEAVGFEAFSYAAEFEEIRKFFLYFDMGLAIVGLVALITASLGIINTMYMSITERRREIGVMLSLGADASDIRRSFLVESAVIGAIGAVGGIVFGWLIARLASTIAKEMMEREGVDPVELFALPWWLILLALSFGLIVALAAGYLPAARAARVDPVVALRGE